MKMRIKFIAAALVLMLLTVLLPAGVLAASDVDFTLKIDTDTSYIPGNEVDVPIIVKTQTDNGYVYLKLLLKYDSDIFTCTTTLNNDKGFTTTLVEEGLEIEYQDPTGAGIESEIGEVEIPLKFAVLTGAAGGDTTFELEVVIAQCLDEAGNRDDKMTVSNANPKTVKIVAIEDGGSVGTTTTAPTIYSITTTTHAVQSNEGVSAGTVIVIVIGGIVLFFAGMVVGYLMCSKKHAAVDEYMDDAQESPDEYYRRSSRRATMIDDDFGNDEEDDFGYPTAPRRPSVGFAEEDRGISSSYFGDADDDDDDDDDDAGFPDEFKPRRRTPSLESDEVDDEIFGSYESLGSRRRTRSDDGFGSYSGDDGEFRYDRRKYR